MSDLAKALLAVQAEAPKIQKDGINPHFKSKYVRLDSIMDAILPILNRHGVVLIQSPTSIGHEPALRTELIHADTGDTVTSTMPLVLPAETPQGQGSALTYARRYAVMAMLGLVGDEDDDGQAASRPRERPKPAAEQAATQGQRDQLKTQLKLLDNAYPEHPGEGRTWADTAAGHIKTRFDKTSSKDLSKAEMNDLIVWLEDQFREAELAAKVPF